jgi:hypothetical protein
VSTNRTENWSITEGGYTRMAIVDIEPEQVLMSITLARQMGLTKVSDDRWTMDRYGCMVPGSVRVTYTDLVAAMTASGFTRTAGGQE